MSGPKVQSQNLPGSFNGFSATADIPKTTPIPSSLRSILIFRDLRFVLDFRCFEGVRPPFGRGAHIAAFGLR